MKTYYCDACNLPYFGHEEVVTWGEVLYQKARHERTCVARERDYDAPARISPNWSMVVKNP